MQSSDMTQILKEYKDVFDALEEYDRTRQLPTDRLRIALTLSRRTLKRLTEEKLSSGKSRSRIVEEALEARWGVRSKDESSERKRTTAGRW